MSMLIEALNKVALTYIDFNGARVPVKFAPVNDNDKPTYSKVVGRFFLEKMVQDGSQEIKYIGALTLKTNNVEVEKMNLAAFYYWENTTYQIWIDQDFSNDVEIVIPPHLKFILEEVEIKKRIKRDKRYL